MFHTSQKMVLGKMALGLVFFVGLAFSNLGIADTKTTTTDYTSQINQAVDKDGRTALLTALDVYQRWDLELDKVESLLAAGADPNIANNDGYTPLMAASYHWLKKEMKLLLEHGADPNAKDKRGHTALYYFMHHVGDQFANESYMEIKHDAIWMQELISAASLLIEAGADINMADKYDRTPLIFAARRGYTRLVKYLLQQGANPNPQSKVHHRPVLSGPPQRQDGASALIHAINDGRSAKSATALIKAGADVNAVDADNYTALMHAVQYGVLHGELRNLIEPLIDAGADVNAVNNEGYTALEMAVSLNDPYAVTRLLGRGLSLGVKTDGVNTTKAIIMAARDNYAEVLRTIIDDSTADVNAVLHDDSIVDTPSGSPALVVAAANDSKDAVWDLLYAKADPNKTDASGRTALMLSTSTDVMGLLIKHGADVDATDNRGQTALIRSIIDRQDTKLAQFLLIHRANPNVADTVNGKTALMYAAELGKEKTVKYLLAAGADVNSLGGIRTSSKTPALIYAARAHKKQKSVGIARALLAMGADPNARDLSGDTALMYAALQGNKELISLLIANGARLSATNNGRTAMMVNRTNLTRSERLKISKHLFKQSLKSIDAKITTAPCANLLRTGT